MLMLKELIIRLFLLLLLVQLPLLLFPATYLSALWQRNTGWSEKKPAKLSELSLNFPKLADWLCMGWSVCQAAAKAGNSNRGKVFLHQAVDRVHATSGPSF